MPSEQDAAGREELRQRLSDVLDGFGPPSQLDAVLQQARSDREVFATWHCYQVIGDAMRSDELTGHGRDRRFLARLSERLDTEPALVAPEPMRSAPAMTRNSPARRMGMAAGFVAACGMALAAGYIGIGQLRDDPQLARAPSGAPVLAVADRDSAAATDADALQVVVTPNGQMLRDAALDQYLQAHRQFGGSSALQVPAGFVRSATVDVAPR